MRSASGFRLSGPNAMLLGGCALAMGLFVRAERRADEPLIPVGLFRNRVFSGAALNGFFSWMAMFGMNLVRTSLRPGCPTAREPPRPARSLTPLLMGWVVFAVIGARLLLHVTFRTLMLMGMSLMVTGFVLMDVMGDGVTRGLVTVRSRIEPAG